MNGGQGAGQDGARARRTHSYLLLRWEAQTDGKPERQKTKNKARHCAEKSCMPVLGKDKVADMR